MIARSTDELAGIRESCRRLGVVLEALEKAVRPGITTASLNDLAERLIAEGGDTPAFKGYSPEGARFPFPSALCISVNDEVVHGIPSDRILNKGDIVSLDLGIVHRGYISDSAVTVPVGTTTTESYELMDATRDALERGIAAARAGSHVGDISAAVESAYADTKFSIVKVLGGHGVGREVHEEPFVANVGHPGTGPELVPGMVLALEPIASAGKAAVHIAPDGYTYRTRDGSRAAHFEHTILITDGSAEVLSRRPNERY